MLQALAQDAQGHRPQALQSLGQAWAQAPEPDGYVRLFLDEGAPMVELLRDAEHQGVADDHARRLLSLSAARDGDAAGARQRLVPPSAERERGLM
jgi:LuxR family maltose regulon positive regulatory protein